MTNSTLTNNYALFNGGAIDNETSALLTVSNCTLSSNSTSNGGGGGIANDHGTATVTNSTFSGNSTFFYYGGAILNAGGLVGGTIGSKLTVSNSTVSGNSAPGGDGGGIVTFGGTVTLLNTIVAGNTAVTSPDISGSVTGTNNLIGNSSGLSGLSSAPASRNILDQPALLSALGEFGGSTPTIALMHGSPAVGAGGVLTTLNTDNGSSTITVANGAAIASTNPAAGSGYVIQIGSEQMLETAVSGNTLTVTRGYNGTTQFLHNNGDGVFFATDQRGIERPANTAPDIGGFQSQGFSGAPYLVTNGSNSVSVSGSLPWAVLQADTDTSGTAVTINFTNFTLNPFIPLASTLDITNSTPGESIILDDPTDTFSIYGGYDADSDFSVVTVAANTTATIENLTITSGYNLRLHGPTRRRHQQCWHVDGQQLHPVGQLRRRGRWHLQPEFRRVDGEHLHPLPQLRHLRRRRHRKRWRADAEHLYPLQQFRRGRWRHL